ncbi:MAG: hypothetical protein ACK5V3_03205 [Bdellovibrionales bacterium]
MDPDGSNTKQNPLKIEWHLFWEGLFGDSSDKGESSTLSPLSREKLNEITKELSSKRKQLHKQLETLNKELDANSVKLESLKLVGAETDETLQRISQLSDKGHALSEELEKLNAKLQFVREREKDWL